MLAGVLVPVPVSGCDRVSVDTDVVDVDVSVGVASGRTCGVWCGVLFPRALRRIVGLMDRVVCILEYVWSYRFRPPSVWSRGPPCICHNSVA